MQKWRGCVFAECYSLDARKNKAEAMRLRLKGLDKSNEERKEDNKTKMMIEVETLIKRLLVAMRDEHE